ncbi:glycosyl hydrolase family 28-related protein [Kribbella sp. CA-293567]|uniref:glycosyl hydrolase family 28-related protein n=1 Tax=Kribbella sp. CA-293567 TaxID=3002436 RepID=UPI0022DE7B12|nr:glycosyl hydrolase family 28-related protein [Kribbella sp. CA-293567]WBQ05160.1 glycosyl hydrolase family 28-related protein [Kribbella sp. CA-293567]
MSQRNPKVSRRLLLGGAAALPAAAALPMAAAVPAAAAPVPSRGTTAKPRDLSEELLNQWAEANGAHPLIPDISHAGYLGGERPRRPKVVARVTDFGARPGSDTDAATAFNTAVRYAGERGGGTVVVPRGAYRLDSPIWMHWSNVVLKGSGSDDTVLHFTKPLDESYRPNLQPSLQSRWSWTGGQIWVIAPERKAKSEAEDFAASEGWLLGDTLAEVSAASRGQRTLLVSDTSRLAAGDLVVLETDNPADAGVLRHVAGDVAGTRDYNWPTKAPQLTTGSGGQYIQYATLQWPVRIEAVLGSRLVRLAQPLRYDLRPSWPSRIRALGPTVHDVGVESLTIRNELRPMTIHNRHPGSNGLCFQAVHDCWADDVRVENCDLGFGFTTTKAVTLTDVVVGGRSAHHSFACRMQAHDNLVDGFEIEKFAVPLPDGALHHGLNLEGLSAGNVWRRGTMAEGTFDTHRAMPFENARTDITLTNNGRVGGSAASGPLFGARIAHWNIRISTGVSYAIDLADVAPRSITVGLQGLTAGGSGLPRDFQGDLENGSYQPAVRPKVTDLYSAQRSS